MESLAIRKLNYVKNNFYGQLQTFIFYGICRIDNIEVEEFKNVLQELGLDNFIIDKDADNKVFVIEVKR
jgi:hypothetical protein